MRNCGSRIAKLPREEQAEIEIGHTAVRPGVAWAMVALFLATVFAVPAAQHVHEVRASLASQPGLTWRQVGRCLPQCYEIFRALPRAWRAATRGEGLGRGARAEAPLLRRIKLANDRVLLPQINQYSDALKERSLLCDALLPPAQRLMSRYLGVGNEQAYLGRDGWLFYRPDVDCLTGPGFLTERHLRNRRDAQKEWHEPVHADPVPAVVDFAVQLRRRGVGLVLLPAPVKPMIHPEGLSRRFEGFREVARNPSWDEFLGRLRAELAAAARREAARPGSADSREIVVLDPGPDLVRLKLSQSPPRRLYLRTDTHWRPEAMDFVAGQLAAAVREALGEGEDCDADPPAGTQYHEQAVEVTNVGDVARMVQPVARNELFRGLHDGVRRAAEAVGLTGFGRAWATGEQGLFAPETVTIGRVVDALGNPWRPAQDADVLLLGDSFSNIYSSAEMGWGDSAGLAERLSFHLRRPVDAIVRNDAGAHATRQMLADHLRAGRDRLAGKKVVVWQFAARELAAGDWRPVELALGARRPQTAPATTAAGLAATAPAGMLQVARGRTAVVTGRIASLKRSPMPGTVPYKDHIMPVHLVEARTADGAVRGAQAVVLLWGLRDNQGTHATRLSAGQEITVRLRPWEDVEARYGTINTYELDDVDIDVNRFWCEELR